MLEFEIACNPVGEDGEPLREAAATLAGFVHYSVGMPGAHDFDVYDSRSGHCVEAYEIMRKRRAMVRRQLPGMDFDLVEQVMLLERACVAPNYRGHGLALRLMREAKHLFARPQAFAILKAHPDGEEVSDADCLRLAEYYASDSLLQLKQLSKRTFPGWLVAEWEAPVYHDTDSRFWSIDAD